MFKDEAAMYDKWDFDASYNKLVEQDVQAKFKPGDFVRRKLSQALFDKEGQVMSDEVYKVTAVKGNRISVVDFDTGEPYKRALKPTEVLRVDEPAPLPAPAKAKRVAAERKQARVEKKVSQREGIVPAAAPKESKPRTRVATARSNKRKNPTPKPLLGLQVDPLRRADEFDD
eukprot:jgi/Chrzof1/9342/UNPLg00313.t1